MLRSRRRRPAGTPRRRRGETPALRCQARAPCSGGQIGQAGSVLTAMGHIIVQMREVCEGSRMTPDLVQHKLYVIGEMPFPSTLPSMWQHDVRACDTMSHTHALQAAVSHIAQPTPAASRSRSCTRTRKPSCLYVHASPKSEGPRGYNLASLLDDRQLSEDIRWMQIFEIYRERLNCVLL